MMAAPRQAAIRSTACGVLAVRDPGAGKDGEGPKYSIITRGQQAML
jgi:hypothetical protein